VSIVANDSNVGGEVEHVAKFLGVAGDGGYLMLVGSE